jgi:membrane protease subunit HflK
MKRIIFILFFLFLLFYFSTIFYTVKPDQEAYYVLFGKIVGSKKNLKKPGIHLRFPWPIGSVIKFRTKRIYTLYIGNQTKKDEARLWSQEHGDTKKFISGDDNFMLPYIVINYKISNPFDFYFKQKSPERLLKLTTISIFNKIFAKNNLYSAILYNKKKIVKEATIKLKLKLKQIDSGIEITNLFIEDIHPPSTIAGSFESVVAAWQLKERTINNAQKYAQTTIPEARSVALKQVLGAKAFANRKKIIAQGIAQNFLLKKEGFLFGKGILKTKMQLDAVVQTLKKRPVIIVDPKTNIPSNLIYMEKFMKRR